MSMDFGVFDNPRPSVGGALAAQIAFDHYGISGTAGPLAGERDRSFKITGGSGEYVLKIGNIAHRSDALDGQSAAIERALASDPSLPLAEVVHTKSGSLSSRHDGHALQLTRFIVGAPPPESNTPPGLRRCIGQIAGRLSVALRGFDHPALHRVFPWTLTQLSELAPLLAHIDGQRRGLIVDTLGRFEERIVPVLSRLPHQAVHGDINPDNIVVRPTDPDRIVGVFDFGDMSWSPRVIDAAIAATYQCFGTEPAAAMAQVVSAFHAVDPLRFVEIEIIPDLVAARCVQSLLMAARSVGTGSENVEYETGNAELMWGVLTLLGEADRAQTVSRIAAACGFRDEGHRPF